MLDDKLKFEENALYVIKKIAKKNSFLGRIRKKIDLETTKTLYTSLVLPHFDYCSSILFSNNKEIQNKLQILQNNGMCIILKQNRYTPIENMIRRLEWMTVEQRIVFNVMILIFKIKEKIYPAYLSSLLVYVADAQPYNLRNHQNFRPERCNKANNQNSIFYRELQIFNDLPTQLKTETNLNNFKTQLRMYCKEHF